MKKADLEIAMEIKWAGLSDLLRRWTEESRWDSLWYHHGRRRRFPEDEASLR